MNNANLSSLRERIEIHQKQRQVTSRGYVSYTYAPTNTVWASVIGYTANIYRGQGRGYQGNPIQGDNALSESGCTRKGPHKVPRQDAGGYHGACGRRWEA